MSAPPPNENGKRVIADDGIEGGRTYNWPAIPYGLCTRIPVTGSTTVCCYLCGSPWGGLVYDSDLDKFRHRLDCLIGPSSKFS